MKKILIIVLTIIVAFSFSACGLIFTAMNIPKENAAPENEKTEIVIGGDSTVPKGPAIEEEEEPSPFVRDVEPLDKAVTYTEACEQAEIIKNEVIFLVSELNRIHNRGKSSTDRDYTGELPYEIMLLNHSLFFTYGLNDDEYTPKFMGLILESLGFDDVKVAINKPGDYTMSFTVEGLAVELNSLFDQDSGSMSFISNIDDGSPPEMFEFINLAGDKFAFQTEWERMIVEYDGEKAIHFIYSALKYDNFDMHYTMDDSIFKGDPVDDKWVLEKGDSSFSKTLTYDGNSMQIYWDHGRGVVRAQADRPAITTSVNQATHRDILDTYASRIVK